MKTERLQYLLNLAGFPAGPVDGDMGARTVSALKAFQKANKLTADGIVGDKTERALENAVAPKEQVETRAKIEAPSKPTGGTQWPMQRDVPQFFGPVGGTAATAGTCHLALPMRVAWNLDQRIEKFSCHSLIASHLTTIFAETVKAYGEDRWRALNLDIWSGCFAVRPMRGGTAYSMHSWGIAVDIDSEHNQLHWSKPKATLSKDDFIPFWKIVESTGAVSLGRTKDFDWMHFQFARVG